MIYAVWKIDQMIKSFFGFLSSNFGGLNSDIAARKFVEFHNM
jgi:hypothetical protein